jgi:hypothetical protein
MKLSWVQAAARSHLVLLAMMLSPVQSLAQPDAVLAQAGDPQPAVPEDGILVQLVSAPSEADVRAAYDRLQKMHPALLGNRSPIIRKSEIQLSSGPSVYYHALVGPFDRDAAMRFCDRVRKARAGCFVPKH